MPNTSEQQNYVDTHDIFGRYVGASPYAVSTDNGLASALPDPINDYVSYGQIQSSQPSATDLSGNINTQTNVIVLDTSGNIQQALDALNSVGGGTLQLQAGTYKVSGNLIGYSSVTIQGVSPTATLLDFQSAARSLAYAGTNAYTTGTITAISGGVNVTGSSTVWTTNVKAGYSLFLGTRSYVIASVTDDTHLVLQEGYGDNVTLPSSYRITKQVVDVTIRNIGFENASGTAVTFNDCRRIILSNIQFPKGNNVGFLIKNCSEADLSTIDAVSCTSDGIQITNFGLGYIRSTNSSANGGNGFTLNNLKDVDFVACAADGNTSGDGFNLTTVVSCQFLIDASSNSGAGVQYVSGCDDSDILSGRLASNTGDGIKLTDSTTNSHFYGLDIIGNGGYGINVAVSGDSNNCITTNNFATNTSGAVNDLGTSTVIRGNTGVTDNGTSATGQISQSFTAGSAISANDAVYLAADNGIDAHNKNNAAGTALTTSITTGNDNCWAVLWAADLNNNGSSSPGTGSTSRTQADGVRFYDSNGVIHPAGSYSMTTNDSVNESIGHLMVGLIPNGTIAFDAASTGGSVAAGTSITFNHTVGNTANPYLIVGVNISDTTKTVTCTFDGVAMTATTDSPYNRSTNRMYMFVLAAPHTGTKQVAVTISGNANGWAYSVSYFGVTSAYKAFQASSAAAGTANGFIGFAQAAAAIGATVNATIAGVISGFSSLTIGSQYYLNDTAGTIGTSAGTVTRKVGIATSATQLLVTNIW